MWLTMYSERRLRPVRCRLFSACVHVGCFDFYAGIPDEELVRHKPEKFVIMTPQNKDCTALILECLNEVE